MIHPSLGRLAHDASWIQNLASGHFDEPHDRTGREPYPSGKSCGPCMGNIFQPRVRVAWVEMIVDEGLQASCGRKGASDMELVDSV